MMIYSTPKFIKGDNRQSYYDCYTREALCGSCGTSIGTQNKYDGYDNFSFEVRVINDYRYCPYCGKPLFKEEE